MICLAPVRGRAKLRSWQTPRTESCASIQSVPLPGYSWPIPMQVSSQDSGLRTIIIVVDRDNVPRLERMMDRDKHVIGYSEVE